MTQANEKETCQSRVYDAMKSRMLDLKILYRPYDCEEEEKNNFLSGYLDASELSDMGEDEINEGLQEKQSEYGLSFDYVALGTFDDMEEGYFRYQISYGGPSEEIRFFVGADKKPYKIQFWFLDWFDGAHKNLSGDELETAKVMLEFFDDCGVLDSELEKARES